MNLEVVNVFTSEHGDSWPIMRQADRLAQLGEHCRAGGCGFKPQPDHHSGSLNN